jgi:protoheme IX farnesyltransferase
MILTRRRLPSLRRHSSSPNKRGVFASRPTISTEDEEKSNKKPTNNSPWRTTTTAYLELAKARLSALVVATTAAGFCAAGVGSPEVLVPCVVGTMLCSSSASALNQIIEQDRDGRMKRTQQRPLVQGVLTTEQAQRAALGWGTAGTGLLYVGTDPLTTALGAGNILLYAGLYTYMKPRSIYNTWVGAVVGAVPPVMGWTAATGGALVFDMQPVLLASMLYLWQMPHFFALSYMHRVDYLRGGFQMIPSLEVDGKRTASIVVRYAWYLAAVPLVATAANVTTGAFALEGVALNAYALTVAHKFQRDRTNANARTVFLTSLWYLPCLLVLFLLHSKVLEEEGEEKDVVKSFCSNTMQTVRGWGQTLCVHDLAAKTNHPEACPVSVTKKMTAASLSKEQQAVTKTSDANVSR